MTWTHPIYRSFPLGENDFRLLHIQPASSLSSPVTARLSVVHYNPATRVSPTRFDALSYRWGDPDLRSTILVGGSEISVTSSLECALRYLRYSDRELVIWVDAICINQEDVEERNMQVTFMGTIYTKSHHVRIWLGEAGPDTAVAMELANRCLGLPPMEDVVKNVAGDERGSLGLAELLGRPYWSRMWIFQEILLANRAQVHCGQFDASFDSIMYMDAVSSRAYLWPDRHTTPPWILPLRRALFNIAQFTIPPSALRNLENILVLTRRLRATDARDKLFALMGTCDLAPYLSIDYSKPVRDVYVEFTRRHIEKTGSLALLMLAGWENPEDQEDIGLPSWTPDFRASKTVDIYIGYGIENAGVFNATKGKRFTAVSHGGYEAGYSDSVLVTEGFLLDTIRQTEPIVKRDSCPKQAVSAFDLGGVGRHPSGKPQIQAFCETILFDIYGPKEGDTVENNKYREERRSEQMLGFMRDMETLQNGAVPRKRDGSVDFAALFGPAAAARPGSFVSRYEELARSDPDVLERHHKTFMKDYLYYAGKVSSMFSTQGRYFGRCNHSVQPGDVVALIFGCTLPVILRRQKSGFRLIGAA
ncbi:Heterokaryon incompatibility protein 6, OR allele [Colletotrichum shisoi]|uniref:Heterokaryon incompatibility protein 6, OR allele n=1 Tax=Colletotrichum shisoi TaxID=2078593 RepID=A0A5Q4BZ73_9PEZI|nr:Heterokaryon incompatibility protein 6, OR allele [Colletotrichum shisoi]